MMLDALTAPEDANNRQGQENCRGMRHMSPDGRKKEGKDADLVLCKSVFLESRGDLRKGNVPVVFEIGVRRHART